MTVSCGQSWSASCSGIAEWTPNARASYDAPMTTALRDLPATATGTPRSFGSSRWWTDV
jgi:hypothetical protein